MEGEIKLTPELPVLKEMSKLNTKRNTKRPLEKPKIKIEKKYVRQDTLQRENEKEGMDMNSVTAKKYKNQVFIGDDGNYYQSKINREGNYTWRLIKM